MTTDDDMREIEAALEILIDRAAVGRGVADQRVKVRDLIRQKLPQTDAEHERAVEAWRKVVTSLLANPEIADDVWLVNIRDVDEALRLMRARPAIEFHSFTGTDSSYDKLVAKEKAAGELLRAAKIAREWVKQSEDYEELCRAIEAAERAGVR